MNDAISYKKKKTLLCIIDNLGKGGAEMMLVNLLPSLNERYQVVLVTLSDRCEFEIDKIICDFRYSLGFKNKYSILPAIFSLRKIVSRHKPDLIQSHLVYSGLVARLAVPSRIPVLYTVHNELSKSDFNKSKLLTLLEKASIRKSHSLLSVSQTALQDYLVTIGKVRQHFVLPNFISDHFLNHAIVPKKQATQHLRLVAIGNIKEQKNYAYLVESFCLLKRLPVSLDIFGNTNHSLYPELQKKIDENQLAVSFKGILQDVKHKLHEYDLFVMSSTNEGFGISAAEAMACGVPVLLSAIPVMKEMSKGAALYFDTNEPGALALLLKDILQGKYDLAQLGVEGLKVAQGYSRQNHLDGLDHIFDHLLNGSTSTNNQTSEKKMVS